MNNPQFEQSMTESENLELLLTGYWAADSWSYWDCPVVTEMERSKVAQWNRVKLAQPIVFDAQIANLNVELKYACFTKLTSKQWAASTLWIRIATIRYVIDWLNTSSPSMSSLMDQPLEDCIDSFENYLNTKGKVTRHKTTPRLGKDQQVLQYERESTCIMTLRVIYKVLYKFYNPQTEYKQEIWDIREMGFAVDLTKSSYRINFTRITQPWLLEAAKKFIEYSLSTLSVGECQGRVSILRDFSCFLRNYFPTLQPQQLSRPIILDFLSQLAKTGLKGATRCRHISVLRTFLESCAREGWAAFPEKHFICKKDFPGVEKPLPRFIPEDVLYQLNENIELLPPTIMRMTLVIQEAGLRIGELCQLPFDPMTQDAEGDYFLHYYQNKLKKDHTVPISKEVAGVIQTQQQIVLQMWGDKFPYLFPNDKGKPFKQKVYADALNRLAVEKNIRSSAGQIWRFQSHGFRHSVGTSMINNGVPQHIVQRFLGHASPEMSMRYAFIHDKTMKNEFLKFKHRVVDVTGRAIAPAELVRKIADGTDLELFDNQWMKHNVLAQALPTGGCGLPAVQKRCPHGANKCLVGSDGEGCSHFNTDSRFLSQHHEQLERTNKIVEWAQENSESRRAQELLAENLPVKRNLERIIAGLTQDSGEADEPSTQH